MAVVSIKNKLRRGNLLVGNTAYDPAAIDSIATVTVGSGGSSTITFSSIPSTYTHLQVRAISRTSRAAGNDPIYIRLNSDSGNNYAWHAIEGNGSSVTAYGYASQAQGWIYIAADSNSPSNVFGANVTDILDYANTNKYKTVRNIGGVDNNGSGVIGFDSVLWQNTNAITSISFTNLSGTNFAQYSHFALYGVKSA